MSGKDKVHEINLGQIMADPEKLNWLGAKLGLTDKEDLINFAFTILEWCVAKKQDGYQICAIKGKEVRLLNNKQLNNI